MVTVFLGQNGDLSHRRGKEDIKRGTLKDVNRRDVEVGVEWEDHNETVILDSSRRRLLVLWYHLIDLSLWYDSDLGSRNETWIVLR